MDALLGMTRVYVVVIGVFGFLGGQFFFSNFSIAPTIAGIAGVLAGTLGWSIEKKPRVMPVVVLACAAGLGGVAIDAHRYYAELNISGDYYASVLIGAFAAGLSLIGFSALQSDPDFV